MQALINAIIVAALESYLDRLGNDGCNDTYLPNTPENLALVKAAQNDDEVNLSEDEKTIYASNIDLVYYVKDQFKKQNKVDEKLIKQLVKALS